jgi:hypothetical protein
MVNMKRDNLNLEGKLCVLTRIEQSANASNTAGKSALLSGTWTK